MTSIGEESQPTSSKNRQQFSIDLRLVVAVLVLIIGVMLILWKPWTGGAADARTIEVRGETTLSAQPDEFVFYPGYKFENTDKNVALAELTKKSNELTSKLKEFGVPESKIKTASGGGDSGMYGPSAPKEEHGAGTSYVLQLTVTVNDAKMAQKVQDYLIGTTPTGSVSPQATFSEAKRKELEDKGRVQALKDSKAKADRTASELGFRVDKVKTVHDGSFSVFSGGSARGMDAAESTKSSSSIHAGENELPYSVTVTYFIY